MSELWESYLLLLCARTEPLHFQKEPNFAIFPYRELMVRTRQDAESSSVIAVRRTRSARVATKTIYKFVWRRPTPGYQFQRQVCYDCVWISLLSAISAKFRSTSVWERLPLVPLYVRLKLMNPKISPARCVLEFKLVDTEEIMHCTSECRLPNESSVHQIR